MIATMAILRKQWNDYERLTYPLVQVPMALTEQDAEGGRIAPFFKNPVMWTGFAVPAVWGTLHGLHNYFPETVPHRHQCRSHPLHPAHLRQSVRAAIQISLQHPSVFSIFSRPKSPSACGFSISLPMLCAPHLPYLASPVRRCWEADTRSSTRSSSTSRWGGMLVLFLFGLFAAASTCGQFCARPCGGTPR